MDGARCRTRVLEAIESGSHIYDYVVQYKTPDMEDFDTADWPAGRELPKINWKMKDLSSVTEISTFPKSFDKIVKKNFVPAGRAPIARIAADPNAPKPYIKPKVTVYREQHQFVPGVVDPGEGGRVMTLNEASGVTPWIADQIQGRGVNINAPPQMTQREKDLASNNGSGLSDSR